MNTGTAETIETTPARSLKQRRDCPQCWDDVMLHEPFVRWKARNLCASHTYNKTCSLKELHAAGMRGLLEGWRRYNQPNIKFLSYAGWWVMRLMNGYMSTNRIIHIPAYVLEKRRLVEKALDAGVECEITLKPHETEHAFEHLDATIGTEENPMTLAEVLADPADAFSDAIHAEHRSSILAAFINSLSCRERSLIVDRFWQGMNLEELSQKYNLSRERVRQIVDASLVRFRKRYQPFVAA